MKTVIPEGIRLLAPPFKRVANALDFVSEQTRVSEDDPLSAQGTGRSSPGAFREAPRVSRL